MYRAFAIWRSKTRSLPAVHFQASNVRARFWKVWRDAMPRALQAKQAREMDKKTVLARSFDKWLQVYRTKVAIRAVARARQMRLPTSYNPPLAYRANPVSPRPRNLLPSSIEQPKPRAVISSLLSLPSHQPHGVNGASPTAIGRPTFSTARSTADDDHHQRTPREYNHNPNNGTNRREPSPPPPSPTARSAVSQPPTTLGGGGGGDSEAARVSLWAELKDIRRRSRTPGAGAGMAREPSSA